LPPIFTDVTTAAIAIGMRALRSARIANSSVIEIASSGVEPTTSAR